MNHSPQIQSGCRRLTIQSAARCRAANIFPPTLGLDEEGRRHRKGVQAQEEGEGQRHSGKAPLSQGARLQVLAEEEPGAGSKKGSKKL